MTAPTTAAARGITSGRPAQSITAALFVDMDNVRARYECVICGATEGPVYGEDDVTAFTASIRTEHPARCPGPQEPRS